MTTRILLRLSVACAAGVLVFLTSCASEPAAEPFTANWEFVDEAGKPTKACLTEGDVQKLREQLIRCKAGN